MRILVEHARFLYMITGHPHELQPDETLCFLHIPKTAGLTMRFILDTYFGLGEVCPADGYASLASFSKKELAPFRLLRGHFWHNIGERLPSTPVFMTILRDPVERTLSQFEYVRSDPRNGPLHDRAKVMTFEEYLEDEHMRECTLRNVQTRFLAPARQPLDPHEIVPLEHLGLEQAKSNLGSCHFVGVTERFDEALKLLAYTFGWRPIRQFAVRNASRARLSRSHLTPRVVDTILSLNDQDIRLYEFGKTLFDTRLNRMMDGLLDEHYDQRQGSAARSRSSVSVRFERPINGEGWHPPEIDDRGTVFRWIGPGRTAFIDVALLPGIERQIRFQVTEHITAEVFESLTVLVNGVPIDLISDQGDSRLVLSGVIPSRLVSGEQPYTRITFRLAKTHRPVDITGGENRDDRSLGIALGWLEITPVEADTGRAAAVTPADSAR
jgi:hypothetical protein